MRVYKVKNYDEMSRKAANLIAAQIITKPASVLGLATGSTPVGTYKYLVEKYNNGDLDFSEVKTANLDEYKGLTRESEQSYYYFMYSNLFQHVNINMDNTNIPNGMADDADAECRRYEDVIRSLGGVDLHQRTLYGNLQVHALVVLQIADAIPEVAGNQGFGVALTLLIQVKAPQGIAQTVLGGEDVDGHLVRDGVGGTEFRQGWESLIICPLG